MKRHQADVIRHIRHNVNPWKYTNIHATNLPVLSKSKLEISSKAFEWWYRDLCTTKSAVKSAQVRILLDVKSDNASWRTADRAVRETPTILANTKTSTSHQHIKKTCRSSSSSSSSSFTSLGAISAQASSSCNSVARLCCNSPCCTCSASSCLVPVATTEQLQHVLESM